MLAYSCWIFELIWNRVAPGNLSAPKQPLYTELSRLTPKFTLGPDDDWVPKMAEHLRSKLAQPSGN